MIQQREQQNYTFYKSDWFTHKLRQAMFVSRHSKTYSQIQMQVLLRGMLGSLIHP